MNEFAIVRIENGAVEWSGEADDWAQFYKWCFRLKETAAGNHLRAHFRGDLVSTTEAIFHARNEGERRGYKLRGPLRRRTLAEVVSEVPDYLHPDFPENLKDKE